MKTPNVIGDRSGFTLVELMAALAVLSIGFLGIMSLLIRSLGISSIITHNYIGTYLAAEGVEIIKSMIDTNVRNGLPWDQGFVSESVYEADYFAQETAGLVGITQGFETPLRLDPTTGFYNYSTGDLTPFRRGILIFVDAPDANGVMNHMAVISYVTWMLRDRAYNIVAEDHFYNWR